MGITERIKSYIAEWREITRLIEREKTMIDPDKLVVFYDFQDCFRVDEESETNPTALHRFEQSFEKKFTRMVRQGLPGHIIPNGALMPAAKEKEEARRKKIEDQLA